MSDFTVESWIWYAFAMLVVVARYVARIMHFKSVLRLQTEDFLMLFLTCLYTILTVFLNIDETVNTNLIDPANPPILTPDEIAARTWGSKTVLLVEQCMCAVQWGTKACLLLLYWRLTQNLRQNRVVKAAAAYVITTYVVMEICYFAVWCRPFYDYWQTPTDNVQCTTALNHLIMNLAFNLSSDILIMSIPLPLLIKAHLEFKKKILLVLPFSLGIFTIVCAILSKHLTFTEPFSPYWVYWYCRESSTAMIVSNMPYSWALIRRMFNLRSFFSDSSAGREQAGDARELHGYSAGHFSTHSQSRLRLGSRADDKTDVKHGNRLWFNHESKRKASQDVASPESNGLGHWSEGVDLKLKDIEVEPGFASTSSSSNSGGLAKPPPVSTTAGALDKLYPLEDGEELQDPKHAHRRVYEG